MSRLLFAPSPRRKRGLILTVAGSLLFHGSLVGIAAFWPTHPVEKPVNVTLIGVDDPSAVDNQSPAAAVPPPSEPDPAPPTLNAPEPIDLPSPIIEPGADDMTLATPAPRPPNPRTPSRPISASSMTHTIHVPGSPSAGAPANGATGLSGSGRPGSGTRWNTPEPSYPASLRLAHVQGNGNVRVTTDGTGRVIDATIVQSTGNALLDDNTCRAARGRWSGPPNSTILVPITYQLH